MCNKNLRVLVADGHERMRECVSGVLRTEFVVIGAVRDGEELVKAAMSLQPDVIVTDVFIPGLSGLDAQTSLHEQGCDIPFVFVSIDPTLKSYLSPGLGVCITKADLRSCLNLEVRAAAIQRITPTDNKLLGASISREVQ